MSNRRFITYGAAATIGIIAVWAAKTFTARGLPNGVVLMGMVIGSLNALVAVGLVLVYRAGRYINFAQGGAGAAGIVFSAKMMSLWGVAYPLAVLTGLAISVAFAIAAEAIFIQRLFRAPRMLLTIATIGIAQLFGAFEAVFTAIGGATFIPPLAAPIPWSFFVAPIRFGGGPIMVMIVAPMLLLGIWFFLGRTVWGAAVEAAAENPDRARLLGISVRQVSTLVWGLAGLLSGATAILQAPIVGFNFGIAGGATLLLRALAPAMIGGLTDLPRTVLAALVLGVVEQALVWTFDSPGPVNTVLFIAVLGGLLLQRRRRTRTENTDDIVASGATNVRPFPKELLAMRDLAVARRLLPVGAVLVPVVASLFLSPSTQHLLTVIAVYAIAAVSLTMLSGFAGEVSFGHWALVGGTALLAGHLVGDRGMDFTVALILTVVAGAGAALLLGVPALRIRGILLGATTLAFAIAAPFLLSAPVFKMDRSLERPIVFNVFDLGTERAYLWFTIAMLVATAVMVRNTRTGRWGRTFVAVKDNERVAATFGVNVTRSRLVAFAASGAFAGLAGFVFMFSELRLGPETFTPEVSLLLFSAVVIGGLGSVSGAIIGALYLRGIQFLLPAWAQLFSTSLGLLLVLMFLPDGLGPAMFRARDAILRRIAQRRGVYVPSLVADHPVERAAGRSAKTA